MKEIVPGLEIALTTCKEPSLGTASILPVSGAKVSKSLMGALAGAVGIGGHGQSDGHGRTQGLGLV